VLVPLGQVDQKALTEIENLKLNILDKPHKQVNDNHSQQQWGKEPDEVPFPDDDSLPF